MIKCLLTELGRAGRENIWLSVRTHGPRCARSVRPDLEPNIFPSGPPTQSNKNPDLDFPKETHPKFKRSARETTVALTNPFKLLSVATR